MPRYFCRGAHINHGAAWCIAFGCLRVDEAISAEVLRPLQPLGVNAALSAWRQWAELEDVKLRGLRLGVEKARFEAERAKRQYEEKEEAG